MNCLSLNIGSIRSSKKWEWVKGIWDTRRVMFLGLQDTRMTHVDLFKTKSVWGNQNFDFACSSARGRSGGIISIWDPSYFIKNRTSCT